mmetsp:Transcript_6009/g.6232  ORF Transcript_6009/g.6232 Transcript_6009/m.6232 type:complete len:104 (-) Transcript_6009:27-338(-)
MLSSIFKILTCMLILSTISCNLSKVEEPIVENKVEITSDSNPQTSEEILKNETELTEEVLVESLKFLAAPCSKRMGYCNLLTAAYCCPEFRCSNMTGGAGVCA